MTRRCEHCGSTDIDVDASRADAVCTNCGAVLEANFIVSDVQFEENAHGGSSAIGTFVSAESKGGRGLGLSGGNYATSLGRESREVTLKNARKKLVALAQQLRLRPDHIDMAFYFFKLALAKHLTRGRKSTHVIAACTYITCRTEGTSHMLIDFSDIMQIDVYELGRTYLRLSQALCINIPALDPCIYVMRFAHRLEFGDKTHEVSMTALRLVSRMKKDWIHFGRRPSGLCGAALLIAARLHGFSRSPSDVVKVVKVHESTLRKRLNEFGETPASQLTLEEFMNVDLDAMTEEQDPPCYKANRRKDRERLARLEEEEDLEQEMTELEVEIEKELEERRKKMRGPYAKYSSPAYSSPYSSAHEDTPTSSPAPPSPAIGAVVEDEEERASAERFLKEDALGIISQVLVDRSEVGGGGGGCSPSQHQDLDSLLMPPPGTPGRLLPPGRGSSTSVFSVISPGVSLKSTVEEYLNPTLLALSEDKAHPKAGEEDEKDEELDITDIDDEEIDSYIMSTTEIQQKTKLWMTLNADYLKEQEEKIKREKEEREELIKQGKDPDKKRRVVRKKLKGVLGGHGSAIEAIEKIAQEKRISTKINYDVLKSLSGSPCSSPARIEGADSSPLSSPILARVSQGLGSLSSVTLPRKRPLGSPLAATAVSDKRSRLDVVQSVLSPSSLSASAPSSLSSSRPKPNLAASKARDGKAAAAAMLSSSVESRVVVVESASSSLVVESGPVEPETAEDFDEEDETEELSAAELLNRHFGGEDGGYGEEEEYY